MAPVQFMPSPHGISKRLRLSDELSCDSFPDIKENSVSNEEINLQKLATAILMRNIQLKDLHSKDFVSGLNRLIDAVSTKSASVESTILDEEQATVLQDFNGTSQVDVKFLFDPKFERKQDQGLQNGLKNCSDNTKDSIKRAYPTSEEDSGVVFNKTDDNLRNLSKQLPVFTEKHFDENIKLSTEFCKSELEDSFVNHEESKNVSKPLISSSEIIEGQNSTKALSEKETRISDRKVNCEEKSEEFRLDIKKTSEDTNHTFPGKTKVKSKPISLDYKPFLNIIQKARNKVKPRRRLAKPNLSASENITLDRIPDKSNASSRIKNSRKKSEYISAICDVEELGDFLGFCDTTLLRMYGQCCAGEQTMNFLLRDAEFVDIYLHNAQYADFFAKTCQNMSADEEQVVFKTYGEFKRLGDYLLNTIVDLGKVWKEALDNYKSNFNIISDAVGRFFYVPVENAIVEDPSTVHERINQLNSEICHAEMIQKELDNYFQSLLVKLCKTSERFVKFKQLNEKLSDMMSKYC